MATACGPMRSHFSESPIIIAVSLVRVLVSSIPSNSQVALYRNGWGFIAPTAKLKPYQRLP